MTRKFICSDYNFELDLTGFKITETEENPWFTGEYYVKYTYPFSVPLNNELDRILGLISHHNSDVPTTLFNGIYYYGDTMEEAILEIEEQQDEISMSLRYGLDEFPNFSKTLSELPLHQEAVADIYIHAKNVISQAWPQVAYNFPCLHTDKIDTDQEEYVDFMKMINYYTGTEFPRNEYDLEAEVSHNRNIIQPLPYVLHILQTGFADAGLILSGDILNNELIKKMLVYTDKTYYSTADQTSIEIVVPSSEYTSITAQQQGNARIFISHTETLTQPGKYRITGQVLLRSAEYFTHVSYRILYRGVVIATGLRYFFNVSNSYNKDIDAVFETIPDLEANELVFEYDGGYAQDDIIFSISINPIRLHDDAGNAIATLINPNEVNLKAAVPDMTFGDFVKLILTMFNFSLETTATEAKINSIITALENSPITDLSSFEVPRPKRTYSKGVSYLVQYDDVNSEDYSWDKVFQNANGILTTGYTSDDKTVTTNFNALPLPILYRNSTSTAHAFLDDTSKPMFVLYGGLVNGRNVSLPPTQLLIPALHNTYLQSWYAQLIDAIEYEWTFYAYLWQLQKMKPKSRVHAYHNLQTVKEIEKTLLSGGFYEIKITTSLFKL